MDSMIGIETRLFEGGLFDLRGRVVVVTGGGGGIGRETALAAGGLGARVVVADIDRAGGEATVQAVVEAGGEAISHATDIADEASTLDMAKRTLKRFGRVDGLVNNAALMATLKRGSWLEIAAEEWDRVMAVNLKGLFLTCRALCPGLKASGGGSIVNISSTRALDGTPNRLHYTTSKAGVLGFTRGLARELGDDNIRVNAVAPGLTLSQQQIATSAPDYMAEMAKGRALSRPQTPHDLIGAVLFLLSPASAYMTGQTLVVDGGKVMR